jgi:rhodanese-related sulfurtransferase
VNVIGVRQPGEWAAGPIAGGLIVPLCRLQKADLPEGSLVLVCQSDLGSSRGVQALKARPDDPRC